MQLVAPVNYFDLPEVSNSDLKALKTMLYGLPDRRDDLEDIFNFGSLVDAMLTEPWRVGHYTFTLSGEDGRIIQFTEDVFMLAKKLVKELKADRVVSMLLDSMVGQYIFVRTITFCFDEEYQKIKGRCKFDGINRKFKIGVDYKTTSCPTLAAFIEAIHFFDYDQQAAWYMDLAGTNQHWIIGISKKTQKVFKYAIERGDATYLRGVAKYSRWAYRWNLLIEPFKIAV